MKRVNFHITQLINAFCNVLIFYYLEGQILLDLLKFKTMIDNWTRINYNYADYIIPSTSSRYI